MQKHVDNIQDINGSAISGVTVTINLTSGGLADIFSDNLPSPTVKANPFTNQNDGEFFFFAANETYDIILSGPVADTRPAINLFDVDDTLVATTVLVGDTVGPTLLLPGQVIAVDSSTNAVTLTLPLDLGVGLDFPPIVVFDYRENAGTNNITVQRNSELINNTAADEVISVNGGSRKFWWLGSTVGWGMRQT